MFKPALSGFSKWLTYLGLAVILSACHSKYEGKTVEQWIDLLETGNSIDKAQAVAALGKLGPKAEAAVPALINTLTGKDIKEKMLVSHALGKIGKAAVPALVDVLKNEDEWIPVDTTFVISEDWEEGQTSNESVTWVNVYSEVSSALRIIGKDAVPALIELLKHERKAVRKIAALTLGELGPAAGTAMQALVESLDDEDEQVRESAAYALSKIDSAGHSLKFDKQ